MDDATLTRTGIDLVGDLPWGAHICVFYETLQDLIDIHADYIGAGLANHEFCLWALSGQISQAEAVAGLSKSISNFERHLEDGNIELVSGYEWCLHGGDEFDPKLITSLWRAKLADALARGLAGMRFSGNAFSHKTSRWKEFSEHGQALDHVIHGQRLIVLCSYPLDFARAVDIFDVARAHQFSIARRDGEWECLETPDLAAAKREISRLRGAVDVLSSEIVDQAALTPRERVVLAQTIKGSSAKESARALGISPRTVEYHRANILQKFGARNVAELMNELFSG